MDQFPKNQRFILGQRLVDTSLDIQECLVEGAYTRGTKKRDQLATANRKIEVLRWPIHLAHERDLLTARQFAFSCEQMSECGRMLGGWIRRVETLAGPSRFQGLPVRPARPGSDAGAGEESATGRGE